MSGTCASIDRSQIVSDDGEMALSLSLNQLNATALSQKLAEYGLPSYLLPGNPSIVYPDDLFYIVVAISAWAIYHQLVMRYIFIPVANRYFPVEKAAASKASSASPSKSKKSANESKKAASTPTDQRTPDQIAALRKKFMIAAWKFVLFATTLSVGIFVLSQEWWTFSRKDFFQGWPNHPTSPQLKFYYFQGIGGVLYMFIHIFFENLKPFDIFVMVVHHGVTLSLLVFSYYFGFHRIGAIIMCLHDSADPVMEFAKLCLYTGRTKLADVFFALFAVAFIVTRNIIYPAYVIWSIHLYAFWEDGSELPSFWVHYVFEAFLWILEILHVYWAFLIVKMAISAVMNKGVGDDVRDED